MHAEDLSVKIMSVALRSGEVTSSLLGCHSAKSLILMNIIAWGPQVKSSKLNFISFLLVLVFLIHDIDRFIYFTQSCHMTIGLTRIMSQ